MTSVLAAYNPDTSPPSFKNHLIRTHLLRQLQTHPKKLTLVQAPPGYGKTSFLKQVFDYLKTPGVWMNIRSSDNDPVSFLHKLSDALASLQSDPSCDGYNQTSGFTPPSLALWLRSLMDKMNTLPQLNIFLNDADFVTDPHAQELISSLLQMSHTGIRVFVSATTTVNFAYASLLMENQVASITQEALRFTKEDIQRVFELNQQPRPSDILAQQLAEVSEGWPAAGNFAASILRTEADIIRFVDDVGIKQQAFDRYFIERVFEHQPDDVQQLLLRLSLLDRFNLELCQTLSDTAEQCAIFWRYVEQHTFITPIDARGQWFRFHQLFSLFLRHRCQRFYDENQRRRWQLAAGEWLVQHRLAEDAIPLALQAEAFEQGAQWMEGAFPSVVVRFGKHITYLGWYDALPESVIAHYPRVRLGCIWAKLASRQFLSVAEHVMWLQQHKQDYPLPIQNEINRTTALIQCCVEGLKDNAPAAAKLASDWLTQWDHPEGYSTSDDHHYEAGLALLVKGYAAKCLSDFPQSREAFNRSMHHFEAYGTYYGKTWAKSLMAVTYAKQGFHYEAQREALEGYQLARQKLGDKSHSGFGLAALLAAISYEHDELAQAREYLNDILPYLKEQSPADLLIAACETQARLLMADHAYEEAIGHLKDNIKWAESQTLPRLKYKLVDELIVWLTRLGRNAEAELYASEYDLILKNAANFKVDQSLHNICARSIISMFWQRKAYTEAQQVLAMLLHRGTQKGHLRRCAEWLKLKAITCSLQGDEAAAEQTLVETLRIASTQNYLKMLSEEPRLHPLLHQFPIKKCPADAKDFFNLLLKKIDASPTSQQPLIEPLTAKEIDIIQLLSEGHPNKSIADQLLVSLGTLKWHLHNIYAKLQVKNRTQALVVAKQQGYLHA